MSGYHRWVFYVFLLMFYENTVPIFSLFCYTVKYKYGKSGAFLRVSKEMLRIEVTSMTYKTIVIGYAPKAKEMAAAIEKAANERALDGWELVTFSVTNSAKAILVFRVPNAVRQEEPISEESDNENR